MRRIHSLIKNDNSLLYASVGYLRGRGLVYGTSPFLPSAAANKQNEIVSTDLPIFGDGVFDWVVVKEECDKRRLKNVLRKLRSGGHFICNDNLTPESVAEVGGFVKKLSGVYKYLPSKGKGIEVQNQSDRRACVVRYGALGDAVLLTPLIKQLHSDGFEVTLNITSYCEPVLRHNPYASNIIIQERDAIPNNELGAYWDFWRPHYSRYINLSESIEGGLLKVEGRRDFYTTQSHRHRVCNKNYQDHTMEIGGYSNHTGLRGELYFTDAENREAQKLRNKYRDKFLVLWGLNGSSHHKVYAPTELVVEEFLGRHPDAYVILSGDSRAKDLQFDHPRAIKAAGEWDLRTVMRLCGLVDCVVGPESALVNFASCYDTPKVVFLSHSTPENLTKYWSNCVALEPESVLAPCYPCHQLHYSRESCPLVQIIDGNDSVVADGPVCSMGAIREETVLGTLEEIYAKKTTK
jgi:ADP-heptose:LPS heptosyltransferase